MSSALIEWERVEWKGVFILMCKEELLENFLKCSHSGPWREFAKTPRRARVQYYHYIFFSGNRVKVTYARFNLNIKFRTGRVALARRVRATFVIESSRIMKNSHVRNEANIRAREMSFPNYNITGMKSIFWRCFRYINSGESAGTSSSMFVYLFGYCFYKQKFHYNGKNVFYVYTRSIQKFHRILKSARRDVHDLSDILTWIIINIG